MLSEKLNFLLFLTKVFDQIFKKPENNAMIKKAEYKCFLMVLKMLRQVKILLIEFIGSPKCIEYLSQIVDFCRCDHKFQNT